MTQNPFALLQIPESFDLDLATLEKTYFAQQRLYHPDRLVGKSPAERNTALQRSADINEAYHTLKQPLSRAQALLALQGVTVGTDKDSVKPSQSLLMETLEWREAIDEALTPEALEKPEKALIAAHLHCLKSLSELYQAQTWPEMAQSALRLGYLEKALQAVAQKRKRLEQNKP